MLGILHGYLLEGSGSNLWTREVVRALCRTGQTVHLICQEPHPEDYPFISLAIRYPPGGESEVLFRRDTTLPGACILHKPVLGDTLPVYVRDRYEEFANVVPMVELPDAALEAYLERNVEVVGRVAREHGLTALHANHAVLMSVVAQRVARQEGIPYAIMPHGSALEYAVKPDRRLHAYAAGAFADAGRVFVIGEEMSERVLEMFPEVERLEAKLRTLNLGVDTSRFQPVAHAERAERIGELSAELREVPRGKGARHRRRLESVLPEVARAVRRGRERVARARLEQSMAEAGAYDGKRPDEDVEGRLSAVDWHGDPVLLFVGRLIAAKGPHAVLAALPLVLERHPGARLVLVGHGPLREPLEAMRWALEHGERPLFELLVSLARRLEGGPREPLAEVSAFLGDLEERGEAGRYFECGRRLSAERVIFTGYLTHRWLNRLFPCADVAVFPSAVREAGPLVFLESLASGCLPLGTDFGGMAASIDAVAEALPPGEADTMRLTPDPDHLVDDIARKASRALDRPHAMAATLRTVAEERYDWRSVAERLKAELESLVAGGG